MGTSSAPASGRAIASANRIQLIVFQCDAAFFELRAIQREPRDAQA
jgi:hypothetical protein